MPPFAKMKLYNLCPKLFHFKILPVFIWPKAASMCNILYHSQFNVSIVRKNANYALAKIFSGSESNSSPKPIRMYFYDCCKCKRVIVSKLKNKIFLDYGKLELRDIRKGYSDKLIDLKESIVAPRIQLEPELVNQQDLNYLVYRENQVVGK